MRLVYSGYAVKVTQNSLDVVFSAEEYLMIEYLAIIGMNCAKESRIILPPDSVTSREERKNDKVNI